MADAKAEPNDASPKLPCSVRIPVSAQLGLLRIDKEDITDVDSVELSKEASQMRMALIE